MNNSDSNSTPQQQHHHPPQQEDRFTTLPDDLFIFILTKIRQQSFKFLLRCSLISKHFAYSIPLMPSVSISISPSISSKIGSDCNKSGLKDVADRFIDRKMNYLTSLRPQIQNALTFLKKFHTIRSLNVVFITDDDAELGFPYGSLPSLINWKTKFDFKQQSFVFLFAQSVTKSDHTETVTTESDDVTSEELELRLYSSFHGVVDSIEWGNVLSCLLIQHPSLRDVTIAGCSNNGGKICLTSEQIVDLRNSLSPEDVERISGNGIGVTISGKSAFVPVLGVPKSGYVMRAVSLVVVRVERRLYPAEEDCYRSESDTDSDSEDDDGENGGGECDDDSDILNWEYECGEEVFREAVTLILVHHRDKMRRET